MPNTAGALAALRERRAGDVIDAVDGRYELARRVWNGMIERRPLAVVRCASTDQAAATIAVARAGLLLRIVAATRLRDSAAATGASSST